MITEILIKEPIAADILAVAIYNTLSVHASTFISKSDARVIADLLAEYYSEHSVEYVVKKIIKGIYESELAYKYPMNLAMVSKFIRD